MFLIDNIIAYNEFLKILRNVQSLRTTLVLLLYRFQFRNALSHIAFSCNSLIDIL